MAAKTYLCRSEAYIDCYRFIDLEFEEEKQFYANAAHDDAIKATKLFEELEWFGAANTARAKIHLILSLLREQ